MSAGTNDDEQKMRSLWEAVLGQSVTSRSANFFALGGTSFQAIELLTRVNEVFGCELDVLVLLEHPSIEELVDVALTRGEPSL